MRVRIRNPVSPALWTGIVFIVVWEIGAAAGVLPQGFYGSPAGVVSAAARYLGTLKFWNDVWVSVGNEALVGYTLAVLVAVPFGIVAGWFRVLQALVDPWLNALNATPRIALLPLLILWFGLGVESKIAVVFIGVFVSVAFNTFYGVRTVDPDLLDLAHCFGASRAKLLMTIVLPSAIPFALVGMRLGVGRAVVGVLVSEYFTSNEGLGNFILRAGQADDIDRLLFGATFITILALVGFNLIARLERRVTAWRPQVGSA